MIYVYIYGLLWFFIVVSLTFNLNTKNRHISFNFCACTACTAPFFPSFLYFLCKRLVWFSYVLKMLLKIVYHNLFFFFVFFLLFLFYCTRYTHNFWFIFYLFFAFRLHFQKFVFLVFHIHLA